MKVKLYILLAISIIIFFVACKSASKLYDKGNYEEAIEVAVKKLQKDPDNRELKSILQNSYQYAVQDHESRINEYSFSNTESKWELMYNEYASLQSLFQLIRNNAALYNLVHPKDYSSYIGTYGEKAGNVHFETGMLLMEKDDKLSYRNAYREFQAAFKYKPNDRKIEQIMHDAYDAAVIHVLVLPMERPGFNYSSYELRNFQDDIVRNMQNSIGNDFVKFYSGWTRYNNEADQVIEMHFNNLNIGRIHDERSSRQVSKKIVIKEIIYRPDSVVKEYGQVQATITSTRRTIYSEGSMIVNIRDAQGRRVWNDHFRGNHQWANEFVSYNGDERALSENDMRLISKREQYPPREEEIVREIMREINNDMMYRLRDYFNRF